MTQQITITLPEITRQSPSLFPGLVNTWMGLVNPWSAEANLMALEMNENALIAAAGAIAADAEKWVSGTTYAEGDAVWSPVDYRTYRRKTAGAGTTDPSADSTNWAEISGVGDVLLNTAQTLTNKTITLGDNSISGTLAQFNDAISDATIASLAGEETLTNKTITLGDNSISGTLAQFNSAVSNADIASLAGTETLANKTLSNPKEVVTALSGTTPAIGTGLNTWALSGDSTPTVGLASGQSATLLITNPSSYGVTWTAVSIWVGGVEPDIFSTGTNIIELFKVGTTVIGISAGVAS